MEQMPERLERTTIYESEHVCLYTDKVRLASGCIIEKYHQIHYPKEAVAIVIFNEKNDILFIHNRRYTVGHLEWEIPAGKIEAGEEKETAARREAKEETGCELQDLKYLCSQNPSNGMSDAMVHVFAARASAESAIQDTDEVCSKRWFTEKEYLDLLRTNRTKDGVSILAVLFALRFYERKEKCIEDADNDLRSNLDKLHTTELGAERIKANLSLDTDNVVDWCKDRINSPEASITRNGKNWYVQADHCRIAVNATSYTIITAHRMKPSDKN